MKRSAAVITTENEELLQEKKITCMSFENPQKLQNCVLFYVGLHFSLYGESAGQE